MNSQSFSNQICGSRSIRYKVIGVNVVLEFDTGLEEAADIKTAMMDREGWRDRARRTSGSPTG